MSETKRRNTMSYYSTLFQKYRVDDNLLDSRTKKRAIGSVLECIDKNKVNGNDTLDKNRLKKLRRALKKTCLLKQVAMGLTFGMAVALFQAPPVEAKSTRTNTSIIKSGFVQVALDKDSSVQSADQTQAQQENKALDNTRRETTSLHFVSNKPVLNAWAPLEKNSLRLDDDSDVHVSPQNNSNHLTVIDTGIEDWQTLTQGIKKGSVLLLKQEETNPLGAIIGELKKIGEVESLNIISHGASGELDFSKTRISQESLHANREKWQELGSYLDKEGDINLFGCNVAQGEEGQEFIKTLAELTNADVAASLNPTGKSEQGGDWVLERVVGEVESFHLMSDSLAQNWNHILAEISLDGASSMGVATRAIGAYTVTAYFDPFAGHGTRIIQSRPDKVIYIRRTDGKAFDFDGIYIWQDYTYSGVIKVAGKTTSGGEYDVFADHTFPYNVGYYSGTVVGDSADFNAVFNVKIYNATGPSVTNYYGRRFYASGPVATVNSDGTLTAATGVTEPVNIPTTATSGSPVTIFDFTISDGGGGDGETLDVSQIDLNLSGTASGNFSKLRFNLSGCATGSDIAPSGLTVSFSSTNISVPDSGSTTCTVSAYWADNSGITDNQTIAISIDGDDDVTVDASKTQMSGSNTPVSTGNMATTVTATILAFTTQPSNSVSGVSMTQPVVKAVDTSGNTDADYTTNITVSENDSGTLSGTTTKAAVAGVATFTDVVYTATADQETFQLDSVSGSLTAATSNSVTSDVIATKLAFTTQPVPLTVSTGVSTSFSTVPVVAAQDAGGIVDTGYSTAITLAEVNGAGDAALAGTSDTDGDSATVSIIPSSGLSTFTNLTITYTASGASSETFNLRAGSGGLTTADSNQMIGLVPPDVNGDGSLDLEDVIITMKAITGESIDTIKKEADADDDGRVGLVEAIMILRELSEM